jgi:hypothetical protein
MINSSAYGIRDMAYKDLSAFRRQTNPDSVRFSNGSRITQSKSNLKRLPLFKNEVSRKGSFFERDSETRGEFRIPSRKLSGSGEGRGKFKNEAMG